MSSVDRLRNFKPSGPVAAAYLADRVSTVKTIRGPVGSGKTVSSIFDGIYAASKIMPICRDGRIHFRDAVIGMTYGQLERNLYPAWKYWLPPDGGNWTEAEWQGGGGRFAVHNINFDTIRDGKKVEVCYQAIFSAIGEVALEAFVRGFEPSAWYLFEVDQLPEGIIEAAVGRLGRFPNADMLKPGDEWTGYVRADLNAPDIDSWYYTLAEEVRPAGFKAYVQPSGLSPRAENLHNLPKGYYEKLEEANKHKPRWRKRFVANEYGPSQDGEPVYPEYSDEYFLSESDFGPVPGIPIGIGLDAGLGNPAGALGQQMPTGEWRVFAEVVTGRMSAKRFAREAQRVMAEVCPDRTIDYGFCDPAGFNGADKEDGELAWCENVMVVLGIPIDPTESNEINLRLDAVRDELVVENGKPRLLLSRRCKKLRKGFASHYCYKIDKQTGRSGADAKPAKGEYSHVHDALQYLLLGKKGKYGTIHGGSARGAAVGGHHPGAQSGTVVVKSNTLSGTF